MSLPQFQTDQALTAAQLNALLNQGQPPTSALLLGSDANSDLVERALDDLLAALTAATDAQLQAFANRLAALLPAGTGGGGSTGGGSTGGGNYMSAPVTMNGQAVTMNGQPVVFTGNA